MPNCRIETGNCCVYAQLKASAKTLFDREFTLYDTDKKTGMQKVITSRWLSARSYVDGAGTIELQFSPLIVPYITQLKAEFTKYDLEKISGMIYMLLGYMNY